MISIATLCHGVCIVCKGCLSGLWLLNIAQIVYMLCNAGGCLYLCQALPMPGQKKMLLDMIMCLFCAKMARVGMPYNKYPVP